jgi:hypothetical protein
MTAAASSGCPVQNVEPLESRVVLRDQAITRSRDHDNDVEDAKSADLGDLRGNTSDQNDSTRLTLASLESR